VSAVEPHATIIIVDGRKPHLGVPATAQSRPTFPTPRALHHASAAARARHEYFESTRVTNGSECRYFLFAIF
jgi:hypothetical protein